MRRSTAVAALLLLAVVSEGLRAPPPGQITRRALGALVVILPPSPASAMAEFLRQAPVETEEERKFLDMATVLVDEQEEKAKQTVARAKDPVVVKARERALSSSSSTKKYSVTERARLAVRISRSDGTFSVRDDVLDDDAPTFGTLDLGVYGAAVPANSAVFLDYASRTDDLSYAKTLFDEVTADGAVAIGGRLRGVLEERDLFGEKIVVYKNNELFGGAEDRKLAALAASETSSKSHDAAGLLTRRRASQGADLIEFGITLRAAPELDADWVVFGEVLADEAAVTHKLADLPVYSEYARTDSPIAASVFKAQKGAFRDLASKIGDSRASSVFPGKILRRVEITKSQLL